MISNDETSHEKLFFLSKMNSKSLLKVLKPKKRFGALHKN